MSALSIKVKLLEKLISNNSPVILTAIGAAGVVGTAVLVHKAAVQSDRHIARINEKRLLSHEEQLTRKECIQETWKHYIPPVVVGGITITSVIFSNRISSKRAAALAAAFATSQANFDEYKEKVLEQFGENKERKVRDEVAQDRVNANPPNESNIVVLGQGDVLCTELYTGRYFRSSVEAIKKAMNDVNYQINSHGSATLSDFYDRLGIEHTAQSDNVGWDVDKLLDIDFTGVIVDGQPCVAFNFMTHPARYRFPA